MFVPLLLSLPLVWCCCCFMNEEKLERQITSIFLELLALPPCRCLLTNFSVCIHFFLENGGISERERECEAKSMELAGWEGGFGRI